MKKWFFVLLVVLFASCNSINVNFENGIHIDTKEEPGQISEIKEKWKEYKPRYIGKRYEVIPSISAPYSPGKLTETFLIDGLNMAKFVRYLAGVSEDVVLSKDLCDQAQYGAVLLAKTGYLTHTPRRPSDMEKEFYKIGYKSTTSSNIHQSQGENSSLAEAVKGFCNDSDEGNIDRVGHRRWVLNPELKEIGFGYATRNNKDLEEAYITMQVFDRSNKELLEKNYIAWPAPGYFPLNVFGSSQAWSVSLSSTYYNLSKCNPKVQLVRLTDNKTWDFSMKDKDKKGNFFAIEKSGFGMPYCIIFRPDQINDLLFKREFKVKITGLVAKDNRPSSIEYEVRFFNLL